MWPFKDVKMLERELAEHRSVAESRKVWITILEQQIIQLKAKTSKRDPKTGRYVIHNR
jgi:hypothetical protein